MKNFHLRLTQARLAGFEAERRFWKAYAEEKGATAAERMKLRCGAASHAAALRRSPDEPVGRFPMRRGRKDRA